MPAVRRPNGPGRAAPSALERRRLHEKLRLLCATGAGLEAVAAPVSAIARDLIGAMSGSIFWLDPTGNPAGFFHDSAPVEIKDFFVSNFEELFSDPDGINMVGLIGSKGPPIGQHIGKAATRALAESNVGKYLSGPLGQDHLLDVRVDHEGRGIALLCLWDGPGRAFTARDVAAMEPVHAQLCLAAVPRQGNLHWQSSSSRTPHLITDIGGQQLHSIDRECEAILHAGHLLGQQIPMTGELRRAPSFCLQLAAMLEAGEPPCLHIPVANGRLELTASIGQMRSGSESSPYMFVAVDHQFALEVRTVEWLCSLPLTYLQKQVALFAMQGGRRGDCEDRFGVSSEALKKHLRAVYDATGAVSWLDLRELFLRG